MVLYCTIEAAIRNMNILIEPLNLRDYHFTFYLVMCLILPCVIASLQYILVISTVAVTILSFLRCSLVKFKEHYSPIFIISKVIEEIIREFECGLSRKPDV